MTLCIKHIDDVSMVITSVVVVIMDYIGVVTIGHVVDELDPSLVIDVELVGQSHPKNFPFSIDA
jgi:hypothetical protein